MSNPSDKISSDKAKKILEDGEIRGHALTEKQRGMFGAAAGRKKDLKSIIVTRTKNQDESNISTGEADAAPITGGTISGHSFGESNMPVDYEKKHGVGAANIKYETGFGGGAGAGTASSTKKRKTTPTGGGGGVGNKALNDLMVEKSFLQERWKALKSMDAKSQDVQFEKSYIASRWKSILTEEKNLKSIVDKKKNKKGKKGNAIDGFVNKMTKRHLDDIVQVKDFLNALSKNNDDSPDVDSQQKNFNWSLESQLKAYHLGQTIQDNIKTLFSSPSDPSGMVGLEKRFLSEAVSEVNVTDKKNDPKIAKLGQDSSYNPIECGPQLIDNWKAMPSYPELDKVTDRVGITDPKNDSKVAQQGQDADYNPVEQDQKLPLRGKKDFPELAEADRDIELSVAKNDPKIARMGQDDKINPINGPSFVKLLKISANASNFLKSLSYEKALSIDHKEAAAAFLKAYDQVPLDKVKVSKDPSQFAMDLPNVLGEGEKHKGKGSKAIGNPLEDPLAGGFRGELEDEDDPFAPDPFALGGDLTSEFGEEDPLAPMGDDLDDDLGGSLGGGLGGDLGSEFGEEDPLAPMGDDLGGGLEGLEDLPGLDVDEEEELLQKSYSKSLDALHSTNMRTAQAALQLSEAVNSLLARM